MLFIGNTSLGVSSLVYFAIVCVILVHVVSDDTLVIPMNDDGWTFTGNRTFCDLQRNDMTTSFRLSNACSISRSLNSMDFDEFLPRYNSNNNFEKTMFFRLILQARYVSSELLNASIKFEVRIDENTLVRLTFSPEKNMVESVDTTFGWSVASEPSNQVNTPMNLVMSLQQNTADSKYTASFDGLGYVDVSYLNISFFPQPVKFNFQAHAPNTSADINVNECSLLGTSHAAVLNHLKISNNPRKKSIDMIGLDVTRLFCGIFTTSIKHDTNIQAIKNTWGQRCTSFLVFSTVSDLSIPSVSLPHQGEESYLNMWQKSRSIWKYLYSHYQQDFDYFLLGGDDMYVIIENLFEYLESEEIQRERHRQKGM